MTKEEARSVEDTIARSAMTLALEALKENHYYMVDAGLPNQSMLNKTLKAYKALEEALAKQEQGDPVAWDLKDVTDAYKLGAKSQQRTWVGLTDEDLEPLCNEWRIIFGSWTYEFAKAIEAKLKELNT